MAEQKRMKVVLLRHTLSPEEAIALGAKLCYSNHPSLIYRKKYPRRIRPDLLKN